MKWILICIAMGIGTTGLQASASSAKVAVINCADYSKIDDVNYRFYLEQDQKAHRVAGILMNGVGPEKVKGLITSWEKTGWSEGELRGLMIASLQNAELVRVHMLSNQKHCIVFRGTLEAVEIVK